MLKLKTILLDLLECIKLSSLIGCILILVSGIISLIISKANRVSVLESIRGILFVVGSIGLIIGAMMLLKKRSEKQSDYLEDWKVKYKVISLKQMIIVSSSVLIIYGCLVDWILFIVS